MRRGRGRTRRRPADEGEDEFLPPRIDELFNVPRGDQPESFSQQPQVLGGTPFTSEILAQLLQQQITLNGISLEQALKLGAREFNNSGDPDDALFWIDNLERVFRMMGCPEDQQFRIAMFLMKGRTYDWGEALERRYPEGMPWGQFKALYNDRFYPQVYREMKINEFLSLTQDQMTVTEYESRFSMLGQHAAFICNIEDHKCRQFRRGLRSDIQSAISVFPYTRYDMLVEAAIQVEKSIDAIYQFNQGRMRRGGQGGSSSGSSNKSRRISGSFTGQSSSSGQGSGGSFSAALVRPPRPRGRRTPRSSRPPCTECGRYHRGPCYQDSTGCYQCGEQGHFRADCPQLQAGSSRGSGTHNQSQSDDRQL